MSSDKEQKLKIIEDAITSIERTYGKGAIMKLGDGVINQVESIPTGALSLDVALGIGGIPRGRVTEIYGPESSGKTTLCLHIIAEAQKTGGLAAFIDADMRWMLIMQNVLASIQLICFYLSRILASRRSK